MKQSASACLFGCVAESRIVISEPSRRATPVYSEIPVLRLEWPLSRATHSEIPALSQNAQKDSTALSGSNVF
jgi:hypothetical protein